MGRDNESEMPSTASSSTPAAADPILITDVLARQRPVRHVCPDGSYSCPFCAAAVSLEMTCAWHCTIEALHCGNPWCTANPHMPVERAQAMVAEAEQRQREREGREARDRAWRDRMEATRRHDDEVWAAARAEAERRGACITCLRHSDWRSFDNEYPEVRKRVRFVRHRGECPRGGSARGAR
jgi:hypothetical protein